MSSPGSASGDGAAASTARRQCRAASAPRPAPPRPSAAAPWSAAASPSPASEVSSKPTTLTSLGHPHSAVGQPVDHADRDLVVVGDDGGGRRRRAPGRRRGPRPRSGPGRGRARPARRPAGRRPRGSRAAASSSSSPPGRPGRRCVAMAEGVQVLHGVPGGLRGVGQDRRNPVDQSVHQHQRALPGQLAQAASGISGETSSSPSTCGDHRAGPLLLVLRELVGPGHEQRVAVAAGLSAGPPW